VELKREYIKIMRLRRPFMHTNSKYAKQKFTSKIILSNVSCLSNHSRFFHFSSVFVTFIFSQKCDFLAAVSSNCRRFHVFESLQCLLFMILKVRHIFKISDDLPYTLINNPNWWRYDIELRCPMLYLARGQIAVRN
jgi:hypothetical protein